MRFSPSICFISRHALPRSQLTLTLYLEIPLYYYTGCLSCLSASSPHLPRPLGEYLVISARVMDAIVRFRGPRALVHEGDDSDQCDREGDHEGYHERDRDSQCDRGRR